MNDKSIKKIILDDKNVELKIKRVSYEIAENHYKTKNIILCSVGESGLKIINFFHHYVSETFKNKVTIIHYDVNKKLFLKDKHSFLSFDNASVILIDDVMNTGTSIGKCFANLVEYNVKVVEIAVLVHRHHTRFPMSPTYKGIELRTVIKNNIEFVINGNEKQLYLYDK